MKFTFKGHLFQQSTRLKNKRDAENFEDAFRTALQMESVGIRRPVESPSFGVAVKDFLAWSKVEHVSKARLDTSTLAIRF